MCEATPDVWRVFALQPQSAGEAREFLRRSVCMQHPFPVLDDAALMVSELVTNGLRHGGPPIRMTIQCLADLGLRVSVADGGTYDGLDPDEDPVTVPADPLAETGRGLRLVEQLSEGWGVRQDESGTTIWFELGGPGGRSVGGSPDRRDDTAPTVEPAR